MYTQQSLKLFPSLVKRKSQIDAKAGDLKINPF
jgi:hypothetical protein